MALGMVTFLAAEATPSEINFSWMMMMMMMMMSISFCSQRR
jgi:hypothetical protein